MKLLLYRVDDKFVLVRHMNTVEGSLPQTIETYDTLKEAKNAFLCLENTLSSNGIFLKRGQGHLLMESDL